MEANAVVNKSFDSNLTIAGVPANVFSQVGPLNYRNMNK
jgi:serine O-acetyltransferase